jgi:hypothetical protein
MSFLIALLVSAPVRGFVLRPPATVVFTLPQICEFRVSLLPARGAVFYRIVLDPDRPDLKTCFGPTDDFH